jgi:sialidase-1
MVSRDHGKSWSEPRDLNPEVKAEWMRFIGAGPGTGICLREPPHKGRLIYPIYYSTANGRAHSCGAIYSDDHGATWTRGASVNDGRIFRGATLCAQTADLQEAGLGECQIAELPDGRLMIFIRAANERKVCAAVSRDGGATWSDFSIRSDMVNPGCQAHVLRLSASKGYLFSGPAHSSLRVRGMVSGAPDSPESWRSSLCVEPGEFGYSCMAELADGSACVVYEGADLSIRFLRFPLSALTDGQGRRTP